MSLFDELKRRNVIRVSMAYLAGAWLIIQVMDTVIPWLGLNDAVGRITLIVLVVGFVPVVIAAWLFEWTPDGIRFDDEVEVDAAGAVVARRRMDRIIIAILALAVVYFAVDEFLFDVNQSGSSHGDRSIAVLPFQDNSPGGDQAYLGNGIADELRLELQHLEGLRVAGRTSSNAYAKEASKTIGELLNVETILEGSVRKEGDIVRINVQLTNAADGFTIWSQRYDRELEKIFEMQEEIATSVAGALGVRLGVGGINAFRGAGTQNVEAYEAYLHAQGNGLTDAEVRESIQLLERAIDLDPNYAAAWSMLGTLVLHGAWETDVDEVPKLVNRAHELASEGVRLNSESSEALSILGNIRVARFDWIGAEQVHTRAIELLADRPSVARYAIMLMRSGRTTDAQKQFEDSGSLEPLARPVYLFWHVKMAQGRIDEAKEIRFWRHQVNPSPDTILDNARDKLDIAFNEQDPEALKAAIRGMPKTSLAYISLHGPLLAEFDSPERVLAILRDVYRNESLNWPRKLHDLAFAAAYFGDPEFALKVKGEEVRITPRRLGALWYPVMSEVRQLPGFKDLVTELNLVEYWREYGWADNCAPLGDNDFTCT